MHRTPKERKRPKPHASPASYPILSLSLFDLQKVWIFTTASTTHFAPPDPDPMKYVSIFLALVLTSCAKEQASLARVTVKAICGGCTVTYGANGVDQGTEQLTGSREWSWLEQVGNNVSIRAVSTTPSETTTMVIINVNGFQQAMQFTGKITPANVGVAAEASISVPQLNRFGERE
jgi:hypothetical protein